MESARAAAQAANAADQNHRPAARMLISSISNRKLHCCFLLLILSILIILSLPLLLIWVANTNYHNNYDFGNSSRPFSSKEESSSIQDEEIIASNTTSTNQLNETVASGAGTPKINPLLEEELLNVPPAATATTQPATTTTTASPINCTQFAIQNNLTLANEDCKFVCLSILPFLHLSTRSFGRLLRTRLSCRLICSIHLSIISS